MTGRRDGAVVGAIVRGDLLTDRLADLELLTTTLTRWLRDHPELVDRSLQALRGTAGLVEGTRPRPITR